MSRPGIKFVYNYCNDIEAMHHFYIELLGLPLTFYMNDEHTRLLEHNCGGIEFLWFVAPEPLPELTEFSAQPGWDGGTLRRPSCSIEFDQAGFEAAVERLRAAGVTAWRHEPENRGSYVAYPVLDPMGNTVEPYYQIGEQGEG
jgi:catechol 2,3-dioxygenase-like lactoylglutathione lyase family enzyme